MVDHPVARTLVILTASIVLLQMAQVPPVLLFPALLTGLALWTVLLVATGRGVRHWRDPFGLAAAMAWLALLVTGMQYAVRLGGGPVGEALVALLLVGVGTVALLEPRRGDLGFWGLVAVSAVLVVVELYSEEYMIDVRVLLEGGIDALFAGESPYGITVPNVYDAEKTALLYGPGVVQGGQVMYGYPYLPAVLLLDVPAHLVGDVRLMHLAAFLATGVVLRRLATDRVGRALAVLYVAAPISRVFLVSYWIEPVMGLLLAVAVWAMVRGRGTAAGVAIGMLLASKQYLVVVLPQLWSLLRHTGRRSTVTAVTVAGALVGVFLLWDPRGFWRSVVEWQFIQPFRDDAMSLLPGLTDLLGPLPDWFVSGPSLLLGLAVSAVVALRLRPGPTAVALGIGLSLLVTVMFSKAAFINYFGFIGAALLLAATTWCRDDPLDQSRAPLSQGSRGPESIDATR